MSNIIRIGRDTFDKKPDPKRLSERLEIVAWYNDTYTIDKVTLLDGCMAYSRETLEGPFNTKAEATNRFEVLLDIEAIKYGAHVASGRQEYLDRLQRIVDGEDEETVERLESERGEQFPDDDPRGAA